MAQDHNEHAKELIKEKFGADALELLESYAKISDRSVKTRLRQIAALLVEEKPSLQQAEQLNS